MFNCTTIACNLLQGHHIALLVRLWETCTDALPDLLPGGATPLIQSEQGYLDHLEVCMLASLGVLGELLHRVLSHLSHVHLADCLLW